MKDGERFLVCFMAISVVTTNRTAALGFKPHWALLPSRGCQRVAYAETAKLLALVRACAHAGERVYLGSASSRALPPAVSALTRVPIIFQFTQFLPVVQGFLL